MYRFFLLIGTLFLTSLSLYLGWAWYVPALLVAVLAAVLPVWRRGGFWFAFLGGGLTWGIAAGYLHWVNQGRLADRLAVTFGLSSGWALVAATAALGALTLGLGGWFGASLRLALWPRRTPPKTPADEGLPTDA